MKAINKGGDTIRKGNDRDIHSYWKSQCDYLDDFGEEEETTLEIGLISKLGGHEKSKNGRLLI